MDSKRDYQLRESRVVRIVVGDRHHYSNYSYNAGGYKEPAQSI
jgi:hypothetical protein